MKKAESTRYTILQKAFELIYSKGYRATSIDDIIATTQVTKGAFYYHFKNKDEMGAAIINEILKPMLNSSFIEPLLVEQNPLDSIYNMMYHLLIENKFLKREWGCPVSNLTQEMTPWNKDFSKALGELTKKWEYVITEILDKGKKDGFINTKVNTKNVTVFILSGYWGIRNLSRLDNDNSTYVSYLKELKIYLEKLR